MKKLLIVVDFQNDFVNGALGFAGAENLDEIIAEKIKQYRKNKWDVAFTLDTHSEDYLSTQEGKNLPVKHCIKGTFGHELYGKCAESVLNTDRLFYKPGFGSSELLEYLKNSEYEEVELAGLVSNICILSNAVIAKTALPEALITVDAKATDSFNKDLNEKALDIMEGIQIKVINR